MPESQDLSSSRLPNSSMKQHLLVLLGFLVLLAVNVGLSLLHLGLFAVPVAMIIALLQAGLIAVFFMDLRGAAHLVLIFAGAGLVWLFILFFLTMSDYLFRQVG